MILTEEEASPQGKTLMDGHEASEPGNAVRLKIATKGIYKYAPTLKAWLVYEGGRWVEDAEGIRLVHLAKAIPQRLFEIGTLTLKTYGPEPETPTRKPTITKALDKYTEEDKAHAAAYAAEQAAHDKWLEEAEPSVALIKWAEHSNTEAQFKHMVSLVRDLVGMTIDYETVDLAGDLINFTNGTFDAATGEFRAHDPADLITKQIPYDYVPDATCPQWQAFLNRMQPDRNIQALLQRIVGSAALGECVEKVFFNVGIGANGKDTFWERIMKALGTYAVMATEDFIIDRGDNKAHDEDLARLKGCRLLMLPETKQGDRLNTPRVNNLTGKGSIRGRHLYGKPFDFQLTNTVIMHTNHLPYISETSNGIWRRVTPIEWPTTLPEREWDTELGARLDATEMEGILAWIIRGVLAWKAQGLNLEAAPTVRQSITTYRQSQDTVGRFLEECWDGLAHGPTTEITGSVRASTLRTSYVEWCKQEGIREWSKNRVGEELTKRGYFRILKKIKGDVSWIWTEPIGNVPTNTPHNSEPVTSKVTQVTSEHHTVKLEDEIGKYPQDGVQDSTVMGCDVTDVTDQVTASEPAEPTDEEIEMDQEDRIRAWKEHEREYLTRSGLPVPPTDEELAQYEADLVDEELTRRTRDEVP